MKIDYKKLEDMVFGFKTVSTYGFTSDEVEELLKHYPLISLDKFNETLGVHTGMVDEGRFITYPHDVYTALKCCLENRSMNEGEWD